MAFVRTIRYADGSCTKQEGYYGYDTDANWTFIATSPAYPCDNAPEGWSLIPDEELIYADKQQKSDLTLREVKDSKVTIGELDGNLKLLRNSFNNLRSKERGQTISHLYYIDIENFYNVVTADAFEYSYFQGSLVTDLSESKDPVLVDNFQNSYVIGKVLSTDNSYYIKGAISSQLHPINMLYRESIDAATFSGTTYSLQELSLSYEYESVKYNFVSIEGSTKSSPQYRHDLQADFGPYSIKATIVVNQDGSGTNSITFDDPGIDPTPVGLACPPGWKYDSSCSCCRYRYQLPHEWPQYKKWLNAPI